MYHVKNMETIYWTCGGVANMVNIINVRLNSFFLGSHNSHEVTLPRKSQFLGTSQWEVTFSGKSHFWEIDKPMPPTLFSRTREGHICWEVKFPGKSHFKRKSHFPVSQISWKIKFPQEITFPEKLHSQKIIFQKLTFPGKSHFPVSNISEEVTYPVNSYFTQKFTSSRKFASFRKFTFSQKVTSGN